MAGSSTSTSDLTQGLILALVGVVTLLYLLRIALKPKKTKAKLLDFHCFRIPDRLRINFDDFVKEARSANTGWLPEATMDFMVGVTKITGIGNHTSCPDGLLKMRQGPIKPSLQEGLDESRMVVHDVVGNLLEKTGISPSEIDIVISCSSVFAPLPSVAAMVVNKFKFPKTVRTYSLVGMGCGSSVAAIDLVQNLLTAHPNSRVMLVGHENITSCWYTGQDRSMLLCNCLFRLNGFAALYTNKPADAARAKYELVAAQRVHLGADDEAFDCMGICEDDKGTRGVFLRKTVAKIVHDGIHANLTALAHQLLPKALIPKDGDFEKLAPKFMGKFSHCMLHAGGKKVLDVLVEMLQLPEHLSKESYESLYHFGNTSISSTFYALARVESAAGVKKGEHLLQLGFGGCFKTDSAVWRSLRDLKNEYHPCWAHVPGSTKKPIE